MPTNFLSPIISDQFFLMFVYKIGKMYLSQYRIIRKVSYNRARWTSRRQMEWDNTHYIHSPGRISERNMVNHFIPLGNIWWEKRNGILMPKFPTKIILEEGALDG